MNCKLSVTIYGLSLLFSLVSSSCTITASPHSTTVLNGTILQVECVTNNCPHVDVIVQREGEIATDVGDCGSIINGVLNCNITVTGPLVIWCDAVGVLSSKANISVEYVSSVSSSDPFITSTLITMTTSTTTVSNTVSPTKKISSVISRKSSVTDSRRSKSTNVRTSVPSTNNSQLSNSVMFGVILSILSILVIIVVMNMIGITYLIIRKRDHTGYAPINDDQPAVPDPLEQSGSSNIPLRDLPAPPDAQSAANSQLEERNREENVENVDQNRELKDEQSQGSDEQSEVVKSSKTAEEETREGTSVTGQVTSQKSQFTSQVTGITSVDDNSPEDEVMDPYLSVAEQAMPGPSHTSHLSMTSKDTVKLKSEEDVELVTGGKKT